jgi:hypothetical protein
MLGDFYHTGKIQRLRPGLNPRTRVPEASMLTTRVPKSSDGTVTTKRRMTDLQRWSTQQFTGIGARLIFELCTSH